MKNDKQPVIGKIAEQIFSAKSIILCSHVEPDGDAFGSIFGLAEVLKTTFPEKTVLVSGEASSLRRFFPPGDRVEDALFRESLVIVADTSNLERVSDPRWREGAYTVKIDHHPQQDHFGDIEWVDTSYPSCCEMIFDLAKRGKMTVSGEAARRLFFGMITDTGRFRFPGVGEKTFLRAAELCALGVDPAGIYDRLYSEKKSVLQFRGLVYRDFSLVDGRFAYLKISGEALETYSLTAGRAGSMVNLLSELEGVDVWAFFCEDPATRDIKVELRSRSLAINTIAVKYGGGGHRLAAGARVKDWATVDAMIEDIRRLGE